jgi:hypothetical protein
MQDHCNYSILLHVACQQQYCKKLFFSTRAIAHPHRLRFTTGLIQNEQLSWGAF